jgi:hypothetical protein
MSINVTVSANYRHDQKATLSAAVLSAIHAQRAVSLLDIGAGFVETAVPYSRAVSRYHAVEGDPERHSTLVAHGLDVTLGTFPCPVPGLYDLVLSSHAIPERAALQQDYIERAWHHVAPHGRLMLITFKGVLDTSAHLRGLLNNRTPAPIDHETFEALMICLLRLGVPMRSTITSRECSDQPADIAKSFCIRRDRLDETCLSRATELVSRHCSTQGGFELEHRHNVILMQKTS